MLYALSQVCLNLLCIAGLSLVAMGVGRILLCRSSIRLCSVSESAVFSAGTGFGVLSYAVFFLGAFRLLCPTAIVLLLGFLVAFAIVGWLTFRCPLHVEKKAKADSPLSLYDKSIGAILIVCLVMGLMLALTPAVGKDALIYHLAVPKLFLKHHGFYYIEGNVFANYPLNSEMLYVAGLALRGEVLAKGIHFVMGLALLLGMWQFTRHHVPGISSSPLSLLVFYTVPTVFMLSHVAYNDLTVTLYAFLAVYAFVNWCDRRNRPWLIWSGVFTGLAMATKYTALFLPFLGCLGILWHCRQRRMTHQQAFGSLLLYVVCAFAVGCPFYVKNWVMVGNPFYPFLYSFFGGSGWDPEQARLYDVFVNSLGMGRRLLDYLLLPWNLSVHAQLDSPKFDGLVGPIFLLTLPFAFGMRKIAMGAKIGLVYALLTFMFWASAAQQIRYLVPIFPFLAIMVAYIVSYYRHQRLVFGMLVLLIGGSLGINGYHVVKHFFKVRPWGVVLGHENRDAFLSRMLPSYDMFQYVNANLPDDTKVFLVYMKNVGYLCDRPYYSDSMFESYTIQKILDQGGRRPLDVYQILKKKGFTHVLYDVNYVFGPLSTFSPEEKELFAAFQSRYLQLVKSDRERYCLFRLL
jgi:hypothetical protein